MCSTRFSPQHSTTSTRLCQAARHHSKSACSTSCSASARHPSQRARMHRAARPPPKTSRPALRMPSRRNRSAVATIARPNQRLRDCSLLAHERGAHTPQCSAADRPPGNSRRDGECLGQGPANRTPPRICSSRSPPALPCRRVAEQIISQPCGGQMTWQTRKNTKEQSVRANPGCGRKQREHE